MAVSNLTVPSLVRVLRFYRWAFGDLMTDDADIGSVGEYLVGDALGCLPPQRIHPAPFDLVTKSGVTIEVKTTGAKHRDKKVMRYIWNISDQQTALEGKRELASVWVFLAASFPAKRSSREQLAVFDPKYWSVYLLTGDQMLEAGCVKKVSEVTFSRLGVKPVPFADFKEAFRKLIKERK